MLIVKNASSVQYQIFKLVYFEMWKKLYSVQRLAAHSLQNVNIMKRAFSYIITASSHLEQDLVCGKHCSMCWILRSFPGHCLKYIMCLMTDNIFILKRACALLFPIQVFVRKYFIKYWKYKKGKAQWPALNKMNNFSFITI